MLYEEKKNAKTEMSGEAMVVTRTQTKREAEEESHLAREKESGVKPKPLFGDQENQQTMETEEPEEERGVTDLEEEQETTEPEEGRTPLTRRRSMKLRLGMTSTPRHWEYVC